MKMPPPHLASTIFTLSIALAGSLCAGEKSSANYTITTDALDIGGREATSANYSNIGSAGLIAETSKGESSTIVKAGYIAQLYSVKGLVIDPDLFEVNEGATNLVNAFASLDDDTFLTLTPTAISWSILSGPITQINVNGITTTGNVYQTTTAQV